MNSDQPCSSFASNPAPQFEFDFTLQVELAEHDPLMESLMQRLEEAGCSNALAGVGARCIVDLQFIISARTTKEALEGAAGAVQRAFQGASVIRIIPALDTPSTAAHA